jgi:hypothetical protein
MYYIARCKHCLEQCSEVSSADTPYVCMWWHVNNISVRTANDIIWTAIPGHVVLGTGYAREHCPKHLRVLGENDVYRIPV